MFNEFCITDIDLSFSNKTISIKTNFKIKEDTVNMSTVKLKDAQSGVREDYAISVNGNLIILTLTDYPKQQYAYFLSISNEVLDKLDRKLNYSLDKTIMFESQIKYKVQILNPNPSQTIKGRELKVNITTTPIENTPKHYLYEISQDLSFCNIIHSYESEDTEALFLIPEDGQYFIRVRVQDSLKNNLVGEWSEVVDCIMINTKNTTDCICEDNDEELSPFLEDMLSMDTLLIDPIPLEVVDVMPNGKTSDTILVYFNQDIDPLSLPSDITLLRRDL